MSKCGARGSSKIDVAAVQRLINKWGKDAVFNAKTDKYDKTCLFYAAGNSDGYLTWFLLKAGADPDYPNYAGEEPPVTEAAENGKLHNVEILLAFNTDVSLGKSMALWDAADGEDSPTQAKIAYLLMQNGADPNDINGRRLGPTPFMFAVYYARIRVIREMAKWMGTVPNITKADVSSSKRSSYYNVTLAIREGQEERAKLLSE